MAMDKNWEDMIWLAKVMQQEFYESLPGWTRYYKRDYVYLKKNIGYAMYGLPNTGVKESSTNCEDAAASVSLLDYSPDQRETIDTIYKILTNHRTMKYDEDSRIWEELVLYDVVFVAVFRLRFTSSKDIESSKNEKFAIDTIPIFKVSRQVCKANCPKNGRMSCKATQCILEVRFIDPRGRVYQNWSDFLKSNTFPECTMVFPVDGVYQADTNFCVSECSSTVWLQSRTSPASRTSKQILNAADVCFGVAGAAAFGIGVASMLTPIGPIAAAAGALAGFGNAAWSVGRSTQNLVDRYTHHEEISPTDKKAFSSWLTIASAAVTGAASTTSALIVNSARRGAAIGQLTRAAHNCFVGGSLVVSGIGCLYQGSAMYDKYRRSDRIEIGDVLLLTSNLLFFGNTVTNVQSAGSLIRSTQAEVITNYKILVKSKNMLKKFRNIMKNAKGNNANDIFANAEVIKYINIRSPPSCIPNPSWNVRANVRITTNTVMINDIELLDPQQFVLACCKKYVAGASTRPSSSVPTSDMRYNNQLIRLEYCFSRLWASFCDKHGIDPSKSGMTVDLRRMEPIPPFLSTEDAIRLLEEALNTLSIIVFRKHAFEHLVVDLLDLLWSYLSSSFQRNLARLEPHRLVTKVLKAFCIAADTLIEEICCAFGVHAEKTFAQSVQSAQPP